MSIFITPIFIIYYLKKLINRAFLIKILGNIIHNPKKSFTRTLNLKNLILRILIIRKDIYEKSGHFIVEKIRCLILLKKSLIKQKKMLTNRYIYDKIILAIASGPLAQLVRATGS